MPHRPFKQDLRQWPDSCASVSIRMLGAPRWGWDWSRSQDRPGSRAPGGGPVGSPGSHLQTEGLLPPLRSQPVAFSRSHPLNSPQTMGSLGDLAEATTIRWTGAEGTNYTSGLISQPAPSSVFTGGCPQEATPGPTYVLLLPSLCARVPVKGAERGTASSGTPSSKPRATGEGDAGRARPSRAQGPCNSAVTHSTPPEVLGI